MNIQYRAIHSSDEIEQAVEIHEAIWSVGERDSIPAHLIRAIQHAGGLVLGAFDGEKLVGFSLGFIGKREGQILHWSHITGVIPAYQGKGIGSGLKWLQRRLVLEQGLNCMAWTFDPLQRGNAKFNMRRLGCVCNLYCVNLYGELEDSLNAGLPTDRFEVRWWLDSERVRQREAAEPSATDITGVHRTLCCAGDGGPGEICWPAGQERTLVEIPDDINRLRANHPDLAMRWRLCTREVFTRLFEEGFWVTDFVSWYEGGQMRHWYVLEIGQPV
ncbi:MAG: GNAT family N-acetyltransferase [Anaerolineae bacterium]